MNFTCFSFNAYATGRRACVKLLRRVKLRLNQVMKDWKVDVLKSLKSGTDLVPSIDASRLTEDRFLAEYVGRSKPCVVRGAIRHWPAYSHWPKAGYLERAIGRVKLHQVRAIPKIEMKTLREKVWTTDFSWIA